jgi:uncharacterized protein with ParB-like and HNH nuclease domain/ribosomal protein S17E
MAGTNFDTSNQSYRMIMGNGIKYVIPTFQRNYSWDKEQWEDLWLDILAVYRDKEEEDHYMGYLVLQSMNKREFLVVDGQQRLTTISLLILAGLKIIYELINKDINKSENQKRFDLIKNQYLGYTDPVSLVSDTKLQLNRHNNDYFKNYIIPFSSHHRRNLSYSNKLLKKAFDYFYDNINKEIGDDGTQIITFIDQIVDILFFTKISVSDQLNAFKVFETLNARGVKLSATDLLKNYLFSIIYAEKNSELEMDELEERWNRLIESLGSESFPEFLRIYWNSTHKKVRKTNLFKVIKKNIDNREEVYGLIKQMEKYSAIYLALNDYRDELWNSEQAEFIRLLEMFNVKQPQTYLLVAQDYLSSNDFTKLLSYTMILSFRYNVICRRHAGEQEGHYNELAIKIYEQNISLQEVKQILLEIYPDDSLFYNSFKNKILKTTFSRNKKIVKYILCKLENQFSNKLIDFNNESLTIEHILPENPGVEWQQIAWEQEKKLVYRLGNLTLMKFSRNKDAGIKNFTEKRPIYQDSVYEITSQIAEKYQQWTEDSIEDNQNMMARLAKTIWKIN